MKIKILPISDLKPYEKNAKIHPQGQIEQIASSIESFGFNDPIAIDEKSKTILEGHGRLEAAQKLGLKEVPVVLLGHLTQSQQKAYRITHNKLTMNSGFDADLLSEEIDNLLSDEFDISLLGFDSDEIEKLLAEPELPEHDQINNGSINVPEKDGSIKVTLYFDAAVWLTKRSEILGVLDQMERSYNCRRKVDE